MKEGGNKESEVHLHIPFISQLNGLKDLDHGIISDVTAQRKDAQCFRWDGKQNAIDEWTKGYLAVFGTSAEDQRQSGAVIFDTALSVFLVHIVPI